MTGCGGGCRGPRRRGGRRRSGGPRWFCLRSYFCSFSRSFLFNKLLKVLPHQYGVLDIERTGMRLFIIDANFRQVINQDFGLDLEFPRQFVNADLIGI